jgi:hypothetical protein
MKVNKKVGNTMKKSLVASLAVCAALVASPVFAQVLPVAPKVEALAKLVETGKLGKLSGAYGLKGESNVVAAELIARLQSDVAAGGKRAEAATEVLGVLATSAEKGKLAWGAEGKFDAFSRKLEALRSESTDAVAVAKGEVVQSKSLVGQKAAVSPAALAEGYYRGGLISQGEFEAVVAEVSEVPAALILGEKGLNCPTEWKSKDAQIALLNTVREVVREVGPALKAGEVVKEGQVCGAWRTAVSKVVGVSADAARARVATLAGPDCKIPPVACMTN